MDEGPVTLQVKIYDRNYRISYPSRLRMEELQTEFATQCKGQCKPGSNRRFFVCIHCGRSDFSNKLRLNQHRFEEGCPGVRTEDGAPSRLLPYPDFKSGQGKLVEELAKGKRAGVGGLPLRDIGTDGCSIGKAVGSTVGDCGTQGCSGLGRAIHSDSGLGQSAGVPSPPVDLILEAAPECPQEKFSAMKTPRKRTGTPKTAAPGERSYNGSDKQPRSEKPLPRVPRAGLQADSAADFKVAEDLLDFKIRLLNRIGQQRIHKTSMQGLLHTPVPVEGRVVPSVGALATTPTIAGAATVADTEEGNLTSARLPITPVSGSGLPSCSLYCPHERRKSDIGMLNRPKGVDECVSGFVAPLDAGAWQQDSIHCQELLTVDAEGANKSVRAGGSVADASKVNILPCFEDVPIIVELQASTEEDALHHAIADMAVWNDGFEKNEEVLRYWAEGPGSPGPFLYHEQVQHVFRVREELLHSHEQAAEASAKARADETLKNVIPPSPPEVPAIPGLWHLRQWSDAIVPWVWAADSGDDFRKSWEERVSTDEFENVLAHLLYWWTYKKAQSTVPNAVREAVSASLEALVSARMHKVRYPELQQLATYAEFEVKQCQFEEDSRVYQERLALVTQDAVARARSEFRAKCKTLREELLWDWCPLWRILSRSDGRMEGALPPLPWNHDDAEARQVRKGLLASQVPRMPPPPLAYVLRVMFWSVYGVFRQLTCPIYGITRQLIVEACVEGMKIKRALTLLMAQGPFLFGAVEGGIGLSFHQRLAWEIGQISDGEGGDIIASVLAWVQTVQLRATQDLAAMPSGQFCTTWCTLQYEHWDVHGKHWATSLRLREDRDIGWVANIDVPQWSGRLKAVSSHLQSTVLHAGKCISKDDDDHWRDTKNREGLDVIALHLPGFHPGKAEIHTSQTAKNFKEGTPAAYGGTTSKGNGFLPA